jgi:hypothetical protein
VPDVEGLIEELDQEDQDKQMLYKLMGDYVLSLPPEMQAQLDLVRQQDPQKYELIVRQMIGGGDQNGMPSMQAAPDGSGQQV